MQRKIRFPRRVYIIFLCTVIFFTAGFLLEVRHNRHKLNYKEFAERAQQRYVSNEISIENFLNEIQQQPDHGRLDERMIPETKAVKPYGLSFFVFENNYLRFWSDNQLLPSNADINKWSNHQLVLYKNGWYEVFKLESNSKLLVALYLVKHQYAYQNKYIVNNFNPSLSLPDNAGLIVNEKEKLYSIKDADGHYLFSIKFNSNDFEDDSFPLAAVAYGLSLLGFFLFLLDVVVLLGRHRSVYGLFLLSLIFFRLLMSVAKIPTALYATALFSPQYYASSLLLNSLGDLLLSSLLLLLIVIFTYVFYSGLVLVRHQKHRKKRWSVIIVITLLATFLFSVLINYVLSGLIINSQISFNINNIFELSGYSIIGIFIIGILLFAFYLVCDGSVRFIQKTHFGFGDVIILFLITQGIFLLLLIWLRNTEFFINYGVSSFLLANFLILFISYVRNTSRRLFSFTRSLLVVFGFSLYAAQIINEFNHTREHEKRILLASKLENEQDLVAEYLYDDVAKRLQNDVSLHHFLESGLQQLQTNPHLIDEINRRLIRNYFSGYLGKYDVQFKYFTVDEIPINTAGDPGWNIDQIRQNIERNGRATNSSKLFLMENTSGRIRYLSLLPLINDNNAGGFLAAELTARFVQGESGLPELLVSDKINRQTDLTNYSYARYENGVLMNQSGRYNYYLTSDPYKEYLSANQPYHFANFDSYSHLFYKSGNKGLIILSIYNLGALVYITLFSYVFTFFSILFLVIYLIIRGTNYGFRMFQNFKGRIQLSIISIVIVALILVGVSTITYIIRNYTLAQNERIKEKLNSVIVLIENEVGERKNFGADITDDLAFAFNQLAHTLGLDFNIYSSSGNLLFSSQPTIYEQDIIAPLMNRSALNELKNNQKTIYIQNERIGSLSYIAAYESLRNSDNQTIGYLNLPYFARESDLKKEISSFLVALINIYVLLFSFAVFATFFISNRITRPLIFIQQGLKSTKLGRSNEPLIWNRKDEIGSLVNEYNRMVEELQNSAERLAKSERESAWREMAKQVAHEIKNPLTPMKLTVQHLQRAWADKNPQLDSMVERVSHTLIEQIETLSSIATAFSDFAKMPKAENVKVNLANVLHTTVSLYSETENMQMNYNADEYKDLFVKADKDQLLRIFSNLVKNAIQSIPEKRSGIITINVETLPDQYIVSIKDNGTGISADQMEKIFVPNFTTKTAGTGLGLAMVKNMVESMEGLVWFETVEGQGTTFFVKLHRYREHV